MSVQVILVPLKVCQVAFLSFFSSQNKCKHFIVLAPHGMMIAHSTKNEKYGTFKFLSEETAKSSANSFSLMFAPFYAAVVIVVVIVVAAVAASKIVA